MALYRCNRCGHLSEAADEQIGATTACPACGTGNQIYPTIPFLRTMLDRYFTTRRELSEVRAELERLRLHTGESVVPDAAQTGPALPMDFDTLNTDHFCSRVQVAPVLDWFRQVGAVADLDPRALETSGHFDAVSATIGLQYPQVQELVERIRVAQQQDYSFINIDLGKRTPAEVKTLLDFCQTLAQGGLLSKCLHQDGDQVVRLSLQKAEAVRRFFEGSWLGWFSFMLGLRHMVSTGAEFSVARDVSLSWPRDEGHGLDLVFVVGPHLRLCVQCRSGDPVPYIDRLLHVRERLGIAPEHYLLCVSDLTALQAEQLSRRHGLSVATPQTLKNWFERCVPSSSAT